MLRFIYYLAFLLLYISCGDNADQPVIENQKLQAKNSPYLLVLGIAQDAGYPQAACQKACCQLVYSGKAEKKMVSCITLVDPVSKKYWLFDATPDFPEQIQKVEELLPGASLTGIFLTHAHIGHYTGLIHLGREVMGAKKISVYAMPRMKAFLESNGPWSQLVALENIVIQPLIADSVIVLENNFQVTPLLVPHRDEFSETVGYSIKGLSKTALFIPDIDKWQLWDRSITEEIQNHNIAFLDGSFYQNGEIPGRDMSLIPHPFITESLETFKALPVADKSKVHFIHFNHTNPLLQKNSEAQKTVLQQGYHIAEEGTSFSY